MKELIEFDETWGNLCLGIPYESLKSSDSYLMSNMLFFLLGLQKYEIICKLIEFDETWYNMCLGIIYESPEISDLYLMSNMLFSKGLFCYMLFSKGLEL